MKVIPLTRGMFAKVDDQDYERVVNFGKWHALKSGRRFYAARAYKVAPKNQKLLLMHRFILADIQSGFDADHIDGDGLNNQRSNLRVATRSQNRANVRIPANNTSGRKGVWFHANGKWSASIKVNQRRVHLGRYKTLQEAASAYDKAAVKYFGPFAKTNEMCLASQNKRNHGNVN